MAKLLTTAEAAKELGVSIRRVQAMIDAGKLKADKLGQIYAIKHTDLDRVRIRKGGRPKAAAK